jgi:hypothetical protein
MSLSRKLVAATLAALLSLASVACSGDDPGEDVLGDGEINDEGD